MTAPLDDRFSHSLPAFVPPTQNNHGVLEPPQRDHTPALSLIEQKQNQKVAELLVQAKALSGKISQETQEIKNKTMGMKAITGKVRYCEAHRLSDKDFVQMTRSMSIHDKGAMALLLANQGQRFLDMGLLPAQAWDTLRREKMNALVKKPNSSFDRRPPIPSGNTYVRGIPTTGEKAAKIGMYLVKDK